MSNGLKLKSADDFEKLLKHVADDLFQAKVHYTVFSEISRLAKTHHDEMDFAPVFWRFTFNSHAEAALVRVFRVYDQHPSGFHLLRLLQTVERSDWLFSKAAFLDRLKNNDEAENLYQGIPDKKQLDADISFVSEANPRIKTLKKWRDEIIFHKDPRHLLSDGSFASKNPLPYAEIASLIEEGARLVNRYSSYFNAVHFGNDTNGKGWKDVEFIFEALTHHPYIIEFRKDEELRNVSGDDVRPSRQ